MAQFLLLARDRGSQMFAGLSPEDIQRIIQKYIDWGARLELPAPGAVAFRGHFPS